MLCHPKNKKIPPTVPAMCAYSFPERRYFAFVHCQFYFQKVLSDIPVLSPEICLSTFDPIAEMCLRVLRSQQI